MRDNRYECGCEFGCDCTKTTICAIQSAVEEKQEEIDALQEEIEELKAKNSSNQSG